MPKAARRLLLSCSVPLSLGVGLAPEAGSGVAQEVVPNGKPPCDKPSLPHDPNFMKLLGTFSPYVSLDEMDSFLHHLTHDSPEELELEAASRSGPGRRLSFPSDWMQGSTEDIAQATTNGWIDEQRWRTFQSNVGKPDGSTVTIHYVTVEAKPDGQRGGIIVSVGHTEPVEKYAEQLYNLREAGFGPIYALDHRGQGRSSRLLDDTFKSHVESADHFVADFRAFVALADAEMTSLSKGSGKRFLHCHSMGCAIAFSYLLEEYYAQRPNVFNAVAANAPLIQPVTAPFPYAVAVLIGETMHALGLGTSYPPTKGGSFEEIYTYDAQKPVRLNLNFFHNCYGKRTTTYPAGHTGLCVGDVTVTFAKEFFGLYSTFEDFTRGRLSVPILIQQAKNLDDGSDGTVINKPQETFCSRADGCILTKYKDSDHNIWFETDSIRNAALTEVYDFYDRLGATQPPSQNNLPDMCPWWKGWCAFEHCDCIWSCSHPAANGRC